MGAGRTWLLAIDVDRTLLTDDYRLLPVVRDAVQHARAHGIMVVLATARGPRALDVVLGDLGEIDLAICFGGALTLVRHAQGFVDDLSSPGRRIDARARRRVLTETRGSGLSLALYGRDVVYVEEVDANLAREFSHTGDRYRVTAFDAVDEAPYKFLAVSGSNATVRLDELAERLDGDLACARSHSNYLEIGPLGVSKGEALRALAESRSIPRDSIAAIGDSDNDLSMLVFAGLPIAMGNASGAAKAVADWTTRTNAEGGVAAAIARLASNIWGIPAPAETIVNLESA